MRARTSTRRWLGAAAVLATVVTGALTAATASSVAVTSPERATPPLPDTRSWGEDSAEDQRSDPPVVDTTTGIYRGFAAMPGVDGFLGIRYGVSPSGDQRWRAAVQAPDDPSVQDAAAFGNSCPALVSGDGPGAETEDCLFLNVWRPTRVADRSSLPVYVFIHGGGLTTGGSRQADMAEFVQRTGVIGVSINYRLGAFGFLSLPGLTEEAGESGNYGFQDQQLALRWLRENVAAFGGDPDRVTIGGESAGAWSVCLHLSSPGSDGLFSQAMLQSAAAACPTQTQEDAEARGTQMAERLGCPSGPDQPGCLRAAEVGPLLTEFGGGPPFPVRGTPTVPVDPRAAIAEGEFHQVPVVVGVNRDEGRTFSSTFLGATQEEFLAFVRGTFGEVADDVLDRYPWPSEADRFTAAYLIGDIMTDSGLVLSAGACVNLSLMNDFAEHTTTYAYEFAHRTGPGIAPIPGYEWGAGHAAELAYLFPTFTNGVPIPPQFDRGERRLALDMKLAWGAFVRSGTPTLDRPSRWPRFDRTGAIMSLREGGRSRPISEKTFRDVHMCDFWDQHPQAPSPGSPTTSTPASS